MFDGDRPVIVGVTINAAAPVTLPPELVTTTGKLPAAATRFAGTVTVMSEALTTVAFSGVAPKVTTAGAKNSPPEIDSVKPGEPAGKGGGDRLLIAGRENRERQARRTDVVGLQNRDTRGAGQPAGACSAPLPATDWR